MIRDGKRQIYRVKYERLTDWCAVCGYLGHLFKECGDGVHPPKALVFKDIKAGWFRGPGRGPGGEESPGGGRGRGRTGRGGGRAAAGSQQYVDPDLSSSDVTMEDLDRNRKRAALMDPKPYSHITLSRLTKT